MIAVVQTDVWASAPYVGAALHHTHVCVCERETEREISEMTMEKRLPLSADVRKRARECAIIPEGISDGLS